MIFGKVRISKADALFSRYIRCRDKFTCQRCGKYYPKGKGLQCSHFFGRTKKSVRFDERNCIALCFGCHREWEKGDREGYRVFMIKWLGEKEFNALCIAAYNPQKVDTKMVELYYKEKLKELENK